MEQSNMTREKRFYKRHPIVAQIIIGAIGIVVGAVINSYLSANEEEATRRALVKEMSETFTDVDEDMTFRNALETITESYKKCIDDNKEQAQTIEKKDSENEELKKKIGEMPKVEFNSIGVVLNGLKTEGDIKNGWANIDDKHYYSEELVNSLLESEIYLDEENKTLFYDASGTSNPKETKISLEESNTIYDGYDYTYYKNSEADTFSLGSSSYKSGFTLYTDGYPRDNAYALFDLKGDYSKIRFDVGRVTGKSNLDAIMRVYLDDKHLKDYDLSADVVLEHFDIDLQHADNLKIEIIIDDYFKGSTYGFVNVIFEY